MTRFVVLLLVVALTGCAHHRAAVRAEVSDDEPPKEQLAQKGECVKCEEEEPAPQLPKPPVRWSLGGGALVFQLPTWQLPALFPTPAFAQAVVPVAPAVPAVPTQEEDNSAMMLLLSQMLRQRGQAPAPADDQTEVNRELQNLLRALRDE